MHTIKYAELNDYLAEYVSGMHHIEENSTLLPLAFSPNGHAPDGRILSWRTRPFLHAAGYIAVERDVIEFTNYEAGRVGYFPTHFRKELNPYTFIGKIESVPPEVDFLTYPKRTGRQVDFVLVWGLRAHQRKSEETKSIYSQLEKGYDLIYTSRKRGLVQLYRLKGRQK